MAGVNIELLAAALSNPSEGVVVYHICWHASVTGEYGQSCNLQLGQVAQ